MGRTRRRFGVLGQWLGALAVVGGTAFQYLGAEQGYIVIALGALIYGVGAKLRYSYRRRYHY